jgi:hypothetical protein
MFKVVTVHKVLKAPRVSSEQPESGVLKVIEVFLEILAFKVHSETADLVLVLKESKETRDHRVPQEQTQPVRRVTRDFKVMMDLFLLLN